MTFLSKSVAVNQLMKLRCTITTAALPFLPLRNPKRRTPTAGIVGLSDRRHARKSKPNFQTALMASLCSLRPQLRLSCWILTDPTQAQPGSRPESSCLTRPATIRPAAACILFIDLATWTAFQERFGSSKRRATAPRAAALTFLVNGFFVVPPTPGYKEDPNAPFEDVARLPEAVIRLARESRTDNSSAHGSEEKRDGSIPHGERNSTLASLAGSMRRRGMSFESILAALKEENARRCEPPLDDREVESIARSISGYEPTLEPEHLTDLGNAKRLVRLHGHDLRFCSSIGWLVWDGRRWAKDETGEVERRAKGTVQSIYAEAAACTDDDRRKALAEHARRSESRKSLEAMIHLARSESGVPIKPRRAGPGPVAAERAQRNTRLEDGHTAGPPTRGLHHETCSCLVGSDGGMSALAENF